MNRANMQIVGLQVEYMTKPIGVDNKTPRFSWRLESSEGSVFQTAYLIQVGTVQGKKDLWDSQKIESC